MDTTGPADVLSRQASRRFQYSLRALLVVMLTACVAASCLGVKLHEVRQQQRAVEMIQKLGGTVWFNEYTYKAPDLGRLSKPGFADRVVVVRMDDAQVSETVLEHLRGLPRLEMLLIKTAHPSAERMFMLQRALPNCNVQLTDH